MVSPSRVRCELVGVAGCLLLLLPALCTGGERALGLVRSSRFTTVGGVQVPGSEVIFDGDLLVTSQGGNALVELNVGTRVGIAENSSVRFVRDGARVRTELVSGVVVAESAGKSAMVVATPQYQFTPAQDGKCRYVVQLSKDRATLAAAMDGNVMIKSGRANASYVLQEGNYAAISASADGVPGQGVPARAQALHVGTVRNSTAGDVVRRQGQGPETALRGDDDIDTGDIMSTGQTGRLQIVLSDGSLLNLGPGSTLRIVKYQPQPHQAAIELSAGHLRAWVVKLSESSSSWSVQTPTAMAEVVGTDLIVEAQPHATTVYGIEGLISVRNIDPTVNGHVILYPGQFTSVAPRAVPTDPQPVASSVLQSQIDQTSVGPPEPLGPRGAMPAPGTGWHIGPLSKAEAAGLAVGIAAGAAAAIIIPLAIASPSDF